MQHALARTLRRSGADPRTWLTAPILALALAVGLEAQTTAEPTADPSGDAVTISHGVSNFGELRYGPDMAHLDYVNPDAPKGGEISLWSQGTFDSFNIYTRQGVPGANTTIMYESILVSTADDAYGAYCYLCTTIEYPENRDWVIFNLRDDVTFADGTPMTAEDVAFSFNLFLEQGIVEYRDVFAAFLDEVEVLGPHRIRFTFTENAPRREVITFAGGTPVFSRAWFEETDARLDEATDVPFLGTGPYVLDSYENQITQQSFVYGQNPVNFYWGARSIGPFNIVSPAPQFRPGPGRSISPMRRLRAAEVDSHTARGSLRSTTLRIENTVGIEGMCSNPRKLPLLPTEGIHSTNSHGNSAKEGNCRTGNIGLANNPSSSIT